MKHKLKRYEAPSIYDNEDCVARSTSDVYLAFEVDAVIAEKDAEIARWEAKEEQYAAREQRLRKLADEWVVCTWSPYINPAARLYAILNEGQSKPSA